MRCCYVLALNYGQTAVDSVTSCSAQNDVFLTIFQLGLFPLLHYAGISFRPLLLKIYESYLLPLGDKLIPCLDGFLPSILLGMEETSDTYQRLICFWIYLLKSYNNNAIKVVIFHFYRTTALLDSIKTLVTHPVFYSSLWRSIRATPQIRQPSIDYMLGNREELLSTDLKLVLESLQLCLGDVNILVQRSSLELLATTKGFGKGIELIKSALKTLLRRDTSLNRWAGVLKVSFLML